MGDALVGLLCFLVGLVIFLAVVAIIGHGLWLLAVALFFGKRPARDNRASRRVSLGCIACGEAFSLGHDVCPHCGFDPESAAATELADLEATTRSLERLRNDEKLTPDMHEQIQDQLDARRRKVLKRSRPVSADKISTIEELLGEDRGAPLTIAEKKQVLGLARTCSSADIRELTPTALVGLARLQASVGLLSRACQVYQILLADHSGDAIASDAATDALRIACDAEDWQQAEAFVKFVHGKPMLLAVQPALPALLERVVARGRLPAPEAVSVVARSAAVAARVLAPVVPVEIRPLAVPPPPTETPSEPIARRRSFAEWIGVFMEESNILLGELIGGTLIVGCSIALVISFWTRLEEFPLFPFAILAAITSALFGAGYYTLHHWKLESTSRGLLLIATLLVPLDFLVLAGLTRTAEVSLYYYPAGAVALTAFGWLLFRSARILIQMPLDAAAPSAWLVTAAMLISAAAQLVAPPVLMAADASPHFLYLLTLIPVLVYSGALGWILLAMGRLDSWSVAQLVALLIAVGSLTFACGLTLAFPLFAVDDMATVLPQLSPALTLLGAPLLIAGILAHRKLAGDGEQRAMWQTLATGLALMGLLAMFGGFAAGVERLPLRWLCGGINLAVLLATAWFLRVPTLHVPVQLYLSVLLVFGWSLDVKQIAHEPQTVLRLTALLVLQASFAEMLVRWQRRMDARYYALGCGVSTTLAGVLIWFARPPAGEAALVLGGAAWTWYVANLRWRRAELTYACSLVLAGAIFFTLRHTFDLPLAQQILWALLTLATTCLSAALLLRAASIDWLDDAFRVPLQVASVCASYGVAAMLAIEPFQPMLTWSCSSVACCWLAVLWLTLAVVERWAWLFGGFQIVLGFAWFFGASAWLTGRGWDWLEPYSLQIYALGIALLSLIWELCRSLLASSSEGNGKDLRAQALLAPLFIPVDRIVTGSLILGQYVLAILASLWSIGRELSATPEAWRVFPAAWQDHTFSLAAWLVPIVLTCVLLLWMRKPDFRFPLVGLTLLALTIPLLAAGSWFDGEQRAAASAARWGLALCFGAASLLLWNRRRVADTIPALPIRAVLNVGSIAPALLITLHVAVQQLAGGGVPGPESGIFRAMGGPASLLIPLALFSATLAGHGFYERLAYYLLAAGWLATLSCVGAYFLALRMMGLPMDEPWVGVGALLLAAGTLSAWSIQWTEISAWLHGEPDGRLLNSLFLTLNTFVGAICYGCVTVPALVWIMFLNDAEGHAWTVAAGGPGSWVVHGLMALAVCYLAWRRQGSVPLHLVGVLTLAILGPVACSAERLFPGGSFPTLMIAGGLFACGWVWINLFVDAVAPPRWLRVSQMHLECGLYACLAGGLAVFLGSAALFRDDHSIASVQAIALSAFAGGMLAFQRKRDLWSQIATYLMMMAATILTLHFDRASSILLLVQINLAALGVMTLVRIGSHPFVAPPFVEMTRTSIRFFVLGGMLGNLLLALFALLSLTLGADVPRELLLLHRGVFPWAALVPNVAAALWYTGRAWPRGTVHAAALAGLMLGVLAAGFADEQFNIIGIGHHVLTLSWTLFAIGMLVASWASHAFDGLGPKSWPTDWRIGLAERLRRDFPEHATRGWVTLLGALVVALALWATWVQPATPYWSAGNTLVVSVLLGALAVWSRAPAYVYGSGLLFNVIGMVLFFAWANRRELPPDAWLSYAVLAQVASFGVAAVAWSLVEWRLGKRAIDVSRDVLPFTQAAILCGLIGLVGVVWIANGSQLSGDPIYVDNGFAWLALGIATAAALGEVWRPARQRFTRFQLYLGGLLALGLVLHGMGLPAARWHLLGTLLLAAYVLAIVIGHRIAWRWFAQEASLTPDASPGWFWPMQFMSLGVVTLLSLWITLSYGTLEERLGGALVSLMATGALLLLVPVWPRIVPVAWGGREELPCYGVLTLGSMVAIEVWWSFIDAAQPMIWMQRDGVLLAVLAGTAGLYRFGLTRCLAGSIWAPASRTVAAILGAGSVALVVVLIGQELVSYDALVRQTPLRIDLAVCSGLALLALPVLALYFALTKDLDTFGIDGERRSAYVYVAELLAVAFFAHVRLNVPALPPVLGQTWYISVMVIAFAALGAGEYFMHRNLPVLAVPMRRTAIVLAFLPVAAFRLAPAAHLLDGLRERLPGLQPFLNYLRGLGELYLMEALCWLFLGLFFSWLAKLRRSANLGIFAAVAINGGLWVLLGHQDATTFLQRPQLWLIPLGLIVLVADHINRDRLGFWSSLSVRYVGLALIYLSSTIEMFKDGLGNSEILPIALAVLAVLGVLLGILFRVRAFLLSGLLALFVVVFAQIWHAATRPGQTWIWWASGIVLGVLILLLFALFEKHRNEVRKLLDGMKRWS